MEFDGLMITEKCLPKITVPLNGITTKYCKKEDKKIVATDDIETKLDLPENVFAPFYNKNEHKKLVKFVNRNKVDTLLVMGMNIESL